MKYIRNYHLRTERWRDVKGYEGLYQVSNKGRVKSLERVVIRKDGVKTLLKGFYLNFNSIKGGYLRVHLSKNSKNRGFLVHRLVAQAFIPNPENKPEVDHINTIRDNNCVWNLHWVTHTENRNNPLTRKTVSNIMTGKRIGKLHPMAKPVLQYGKDGNFIKEWECAAYIEKDLGYDHSFVGNCCKGKLKTAYGYIWKYKPDILKEND